MRVGKGDILSQAMRFIIYSRSYCHLCEDLRLALLVAMEAQAIQVEMIDVDADPQLVERYDELVPVLMGEAAEGTWREICHYVLDEAALHRHLAELGISS